MIIEGTTCIIPTQASKRHCLCWQLTIENICVDILEHFTSTAFHPPAQFVQLKLMFHMHLVRYCLKICSIEIKTFQETLTNLPYSEYNTEGQKVPITTGLMLHEQPHRKNTENQEKKKEIFTYIIHVLRKEILESLANGIAFSDNALSVNIPRARRIC